MTVDEIMSILTAKNIDADTHFTRFKKETASQDVDQFIGFLFYQNIIDAALFSELHTTGNIELTKFEDGLDRASISRTQTITIRVHNAFEQKKLSSPFNQESHPTETDTEDLTRYELLGLLGQGAMGTVHIARDIKLRRKVAIKTLITSMAKKSGGMWRFLREAQITSQLDHPNIVPTYGLEVAPDGSVAYAMKLVKGRELTDLLNETRDLYLNNQPIGKDHSLEQRLEIFVKICDAMSFAHSKQIVHRDLKPANIMLGPYHEVYVMDWGIARTMGETEATNDHALDLKEADQVNSSNIERTKVGSILGTPKYMSPEQALGKNSALDDRSDLYTLGIILQEMVTLKDAVQGGKVVDVIQRVREGKRQPIEHLQPSMTVPRELVGIINCATQLHPEARYSSVRDLSDDIRRYLRNEEVKAAPDSRIQRLARWISRHREAALGLIVGSSTMFLGATTTIAALIYGQARVNRAYAHEQRLTTLMTEVTHQSHLVDGEFRRYEAELEYLAGAAETVITHAETSSSPVFFSRNFTESVPPVALTHSLYYNQKVSSAWPVYHLAPGVSENQVDRELHQLTWLQPIFKTMMLDSYHIDPHDLSIAEQNQLILNVGLPMHRVFVSLENGVHVAYPGMEGYPADYDGRQRPYYVPIKDKIGIHWGQPYQDIYGHGLVLPASVAIYNDQDQFRGVAGFEVTLNYIIDNFLDIFAADYVLEAMLVNREGLVMAHQIHQGQDGPVGELHGNQPIDLYPFPIPDVVSAIQQGREGWLEVKSPGHQFVVFYYLESIDWYYVVVADGEQLLSSGTIGGARLHERRDQ